MDTIHTLNTSLPSSTADANATGRTGLTQTPSTSTASTAARPASAQPLASTRAATPSAPNPPPPSSLSAAFKAAAYSVTQLYRAAASETDHARATGYQDAMEELLAFLDDENLGLGDGEGWLVRQWATQRLDPSIYGAGLGGQPADSSAQETQTPQAPRQTPTPTPPTADPAGLPRSSSTKPNPSDSRSDASAKDAEMTTSEDQPTPNPSSSAPPSLSISTHPDITNYDFNFTQQPGLYPRARLSSDVRAWASTPSHSVSKSMLPISLGSLGQGAGVKRKSPPHINDYFDFSGAFTNTGNAWWGQGGGGGGGGADGPGPGKRGRMD